MKEFWPDILKWGSTIAGAIMGFFGEWNAVLTCLLVMNAVDYATGLLCALRGRSTKTTSGGVSSHVGYDGIARKAFIWLVILLTTCLDHVIGNGTSAFQTAAAFYYIANEGLSIVENAALMELPVPPFIENILEVLLEKSGKHEEEIKKIEHDPENEE